MAQTNQQTRLEATAGRKSGDSARKRRARYLIQLGGLVVKAGLTEQFRLKEADLQKDDAQNAQVAELAGALDVLCGLLREKKFASNEYLRERGERLLGDRE